MPCGVRRTVASSPPMAEPLTKSLKLAVPSAGCAKAAEAPSSTKAAAMAARVPRVAARQVI